MERFNEIASAELQTRQERRVRRRKGSRRQRQKIGWVKGESGTCSIGDGPAEGSRRSAGQEDRGYDVRGVQGMVFSVIISRKFQSINNKTVSVSNILLNLYRLPTLS